VLFHPSYANCSLSDTIQAGFSCYYKTKSDMAVFQTLLDHGWDINGSMDYAGDALIHALKCAPSDAVAPTWLLLHGADPTANTAPGVPSSTLEVACSAGAPLDVVRLLVQKGAVVKGSAALVLAAQRGAVDVCGLLLENGADIDTVPTGGDALIGKSKEDWGTAVHGAAAMGKKKCVEFLLGKGANKGIKNGMGLTPLELAKMRRHHDCVGILA
jgi:ankyrin repeat protein